MTRPSRSTVSRFAVLILVVSVVGISAYGSAAETERSNTPLVLPDHVAEDLSPTYLRELGDRIASVGGVQAEILADGVVERSEMERAALAVHACMKSAGIDVIEFSYKPGHLTITYAHRETPGGVTTHEDLTYDKCVASNYGLVAEVRGLQTWPTEEERQRDWEAVRTCVRGHGVEEQFDEDLAFIGSNPAAIEMLNDCFQQVNTERHFGESDR